MSARKLIITAPTALLLSLCLLLAWQIPAHSHGVTVKAQQNSAIVVTGIYSDGSPMSFVNVKVLTPAGNTHQVGNTDAVGRFAFVPGQTGKWLVTLTDGMGHKGEIAWQQKSNKAAPGASKDAPSASSSSAQPMKASKWERAAWGLSLLFWLSGLVFWRKGFRNSRQAAGGVRIK